MKNIVRTAVASTALALTSLAGSWDLHAQAPGCFVQGGDPAARPSPLDSAMVRMGDGTVKVCYGAPSARGREIIGALVPFGSPWRMGANEATSLHLDFDADIGGASVPAGSYSLYAVPGEEEWTIHVNGSVERWGIPINEGVMGEDVATFTVPAGMLEEPVERLSYSLETADGGADLIVEWEHTRLRIPIRPAS